MYVNKVSACSSFWVQNVHKYINIQTFKDIPVKDNMIVLS